MATIPLPSDFSEFLKLLNAHEVKYLLVGGYAVGYYGYVRATADMDIWIEGTPENADHMLEAVTESFLVFKSRKNSSLWCPSDSY